MHRSARTVLVPGVLLVVLALLVPLASSPASAGGSRGRGAGRAAAPVIARDFPDPTVVRHDGRWVAVGTGPWAPRAVAPSPAGPWRSAGRALPSLPSWARGRSIWASDLVPSGDGWLLYFSALVRGLGPDGRCIGVARADSPLDTFRPTGRPLVCPRTAKGPAAGDPVNPPGVPTPAGVIDPDAGTSPGGRRFLTYRTQGVPATIRIVRLDRSGTKVRRGSIGVPLVASAGVIENPVLLRRGQTWVLLTSEGYYGSCRYTTTVRRATLLGGLAVAPRETLLSRDGDGLCGPGGADLVGSTLFFHSWTCPRAQPHCRAGRDYHRRQRSLGASRSLFAATLRWSRSDRPRIASYVVPARQPDVVDATDDPLQETGTAPVPTGPADPPTDPVTGLVTGVVGLLPGLLDLLGLGRDQAR